MKDCVFCKIVQGEIPAKKVYEDSDYLAFLDAFPTMFGQVLVIPKKHFSDYIFDLDKSEYCNLMRVSKKVAKAMDFGLDALRTCVVIEGLEVSHVHVRLYPIFEGDSLNLSGKVQISNEKMSEIAEKIKLGFKDSN